jgi:hypothetical protein
MSASATALLHGVLFAVESRPIRIENPNGNIPVDQLATKAFTIAEKHYGSREAMAEVARKRSEIADVVASHLAREVVPK